MLGKLWRLMISLFGISALGLGLMQWLAKRSPSPDNPDPASFIMDLPDAVTVTRKANDDIVIRWDAKLGAVSIYAGTQPDAIDRGKPIAQVSDRTSITLTDLDPKQRYYFEVVGEADSHIVAERTLRLDDAPNFRDVGGYLTVDGKQTKWGQVYRSGRLSELTENDQQYLTALGVKLVCDLRGTDETKRAPDNLPEGITYLATTVINPDSDTSIFERLKVLIFQRHKLGQVFADVMERAYTHIMIEENTDVIRTIFERLAEADNLPVVIHCTAGKDRTGITIALLLCLLGVDQEIALADYSLSNHAYHQIERHTDGIVKQLRIFGVTSDDLYPLIIADTNRMRRTLDLINARYGSVETYLRDRVMISDNTISALKANLLV